jgi:hypothetical protein
MVAHVEIPVGEGCLDLHGMYTQMALNCTYQRKMFPGLIYRPETSPVVLLCFFSGKVVITGGKTMQDVYSGWSRLWPTLRGFVTAQPCDPPALLSSQAQHKRLKSSRLLANGRERHERLPLERHAAAGDALGLADALIEPAGSGERGAQIQGLLDLPELEGLCDDLAAEGGPALL